MGPVFIAQKMFCKVFKNLYKDTCKMRLFKYVITRNISVSKVKEFFRVVKLYQIQIIKQKQDIFTTSV